MSIAFNDPRVQFAAEAVTQAAQLVRLVQSDMVGGAQLKDDKSPVTIGDYAAQALVGRLLQEAFPEVALVAEESAETLRTAAGAPMLERIVGFVREFRAEATGQAVCDWIDLGAASSGAFFWTLDPIDGTKGFLRGGQYAVALALVERGQVEIGALACPQLSADCAAKSGDGALVLAVRGEGCWARALDGAGEFRRLQVSRVTVPEDARVLRSFEKGHTNVDELGEITKVLGSQAEPVLMDSQAKYAVLASGHGDLLLRLLSPKQPDYREKIWDQAAGSIVVEEAGGRISDLAGRPLDFGQGRTLAANRGVLASNGWLHEAAVEVVRRVERV